MDTGHTWCDILERRRRSSDLIWLTFHSWSAAQHKYSKNRDLREIRNDVFKHSAIENLLLESGDNKRRIETILDEMCHSWSLSTIRFVGFFVTKIMKSIYRHVWIDDYIEVPRNFPISPLSSRGSLKEVLDLIAADCPVLLMPTHRSYADFIIFSYMCFDLNLPLPAIAAGVDFLSLNQVASLLRSCGAFFIRRSFKNDSIYWETFTAYLESLIEGGERPVEFFIEGTRSRSGKSLTPKTGLLGVALNLFLTGCLTDLVILPISISYDRTLEEELYAKELAGPNFLNNPDCGSKPKETTPHLISGARKILSEDFGSIHLRFSPPVSVRQMSYNFAGGDVRRQSRLPNRKFDVRKSFVDFVAKKIITRQVDNLVLSSFPFLTMIILTFDFSHKSLVFLNSREMLEKVECLTCLVPSQCMSYLNLGIDLAQDLNVCLQVHKKLIHTKGNSGSEDIEWALSSDLAVKSDILTKLQLHHYANQALQLLIDLAIICQSSCDWNKYVSIKRILCNEFIFCEDDIETKYNDSCHKYCALSENVRSTLKHHVNFFLQSYLFVTKFLLNKLQLIIPSQESHGITIKNLVIEIQQDLDLSSDLISNAINLMISRSILSRNDKNMIVLRSEQQLSNLCDGISILLNEQEVFQQKARL